MTATTAILALAGLLVASVIVGLVLRRRQGRIRRARTAERVDPALLGATALGERATLVQFSTEMCARCPGVRRMLSSAAADRDGVLYLDVDLTHRPDLAKTFHVLQTPTTLLLDQGGAVHARIGGIPGRDLLDLELDRLTGENAHA